jgi:hypothetical protein
VPVADPTATLKTPNGTYTAQLNRDGTVTIWLDRVSFVAEGRWTGSQIELWSKVLAEPVPAELSGRLAAGVASARS